MESSAELGGKGQCECPKVSVLDLYRLSKEAGVLGVNRVKGQEQEVRSERD